MQLSIASKSRRIWFTLTIKFRAMRAMRLSHASSFLTPICRKRIAASVQLSMPSCKLSGPQDSSIHQPSRKTVVATRDWFRVQKTVAKRKEHIISYNSYNILSLPVLELALACYRPTLVEAKNSLPPWRNINQWNAWLEFQIIAMQRHGPWK